MEIRRSLGSGQVLALLRRSMGSHLASRKSRTITSHSVSEIFSSDNPSLSWLPTTRKSARLRKIRPSASRSRRFSMSSKTLMSGSGPVHSRVLVLSMRDLGPLGDPFSDDDCAMPISGTAQHSTASPSAFFLCRSLRLDPWNASTLPRLNEICNYYNRHLGHQFRAYAISSASVGI